jgi:hypothetical protein
VALIGTKLEVQLPQDYVYAMVHYPYPLDSDLVEVVFFPDPEKVVEENEYYRREGFYGHAWPKHFLIIGSMGNFDRIFLDTTRKDSRVFFADHELSHGADQLAVEDFQKFSLPQWLKAVFESWKEARKTGK